MATNIVYSTCAHCGEPIVQHNNGRWRHCADTSRWCDSDDFDPEGPTATPDKG